MSNVTTLMTIVAMALVTYGTRVGGYLLLRNRVLSARALAVMEAAPGCVLISVIAPNFASTNPADLAALAMTILAATRLPILPTVLIGIGSAALLRHVFP
ncbi:branched-chain amino acid transport [Caballeronia calidae]|uniref:Branched-chain amino acid transport n=1 Tax=Caballeronia calidae TaxID=1777139 RepID=A0A158EER8_9BURK|nr:AzlD family protein [Caballeronia calidae]SAL05304.1 branched-chain amino acid transport [Caballeronia calidae]